MLINLNESTNRSVVHSDYRNRKGGGKGILNVWPWCLKYQSSALCLPQSQGWAVLKLGAQCSYLTPRAHTQPKFYCAPRHSTPATCPSPHNGLFFLAFRMLLAYEVRAATIRTQRQLWGHQGPHYRFPPIFCLGGVLQPQWSPLQEDLTQIRALWWQALYSWPQESLCLPSTPLLSPHLFSSLTCSTAWSQARNCSSAWGW